MENRTRMMSADLRRGWCSKLVMGLAVVGLGSGLTSSPQAEAAYPSTIEMDRVKSLAYQLEIDTDSAYAEAAYYNSGDFTEEQALEDLYHLSQQAEEFFNQVELNENTPWETEEDFQDLNESFVEAQNQFRLLTAYNETRLVEDNGEYEPISYLFDTIEDTIGNLRYYYIQTSNYSSYVGYNTYPYCPGHPSYRHHYSVDFHFYYRHSHYWHRHHRYSRYFPWRATYRYGYGRFNHHYRTRYIHPWHDFYWHRRAWRNYRDIVGFRGHFGRRVQRHTHYRDWLGRVVIRPHHRPHRWHQVWDPTIEPRRPRPGFNRRHWQPVRGHRGIGPRRGHVRPRIPRHGRVNPPRRGMPRVNPPRGGMPKVNPPRGGMPRVNPPRGGMPRVNPPRGGMPRVNPPRGGMPRVNPPRGGMPRVMPPRRGGGNVTPPRSGGGNNRAGMSRGGNGGSNRGGMSRGGNGGGRRGMGRG